MTSSENSFKFHGNTASQHRNLSAFLYEEELIRLVRSGEKSFFRALIRPYERVMFVAAYSVLRNYADAEEAVQEGVLNLSLYMVDEVSMELRLEIQRHLSWCRRCEVLADSVRKVLIISGDEHTFEIPVGYEERLHSFLDEHL